MPRLRSLQLVYLASFLLSSFLFAPPLLAAPPSSPYTPGETLNPTCSPGDANCTVVAPPAGTGSAGLLTYWSASSTVSSSLSLFWDNANIRLGIGASQPSSTLHIIAGTTGATTLQLMGLPNQTGNLLTVGSSSGQRYFTVSSLGLASSTEFRSPSSTIDTLTLASASSTGNITIGGTFQANAGQTTLSSVSSTNLFGSGYLNFVSGRADLQAVSSTNLSVSGYGLFPTLLAQNAVGFGSLSTSTSLVFIQGTQTGSTTLNIRGFTNQTANLFTISSSTGVNFFTISALGLASSTEFRSPSSTIGALFDTQGNKYATSSAFTAGVDTQLLFGQQGGGATSSLSFTLTTSTSQLLFTGSNLSIAPNTTSTSLVFLQGSQITSTTLNLFGAANQTASLLTISSSTGIPLFNINAIGQVAIATSTYPSSSTLLTIASSSQIFNISAGGNIMIGTSTSPNAALLQIATTTNIFTILSNGRVGIGTSTPGSALDVKGTLRLSGSASGYVGFAPAAAAGATTYTLPSADGSSGQVLTTDGSGTLSWTTKVEGTSQDFKGLSLRTHPNANIATTTVYLDHADEIVMDTGNRVATWDDLSADITVSGAGGLDTGSEAASTWYEIYAIRKSSDGTKNLLLHRAKDYFLDESQTTDDGSREIRTATQTAEGQTFDTDVTGPVEMIDVKIGRNGAVSGRIWAEIYATSGGLPTGSVLATSDKLDASLISTSDQVVRFIFRSPATLTAGTTYALALTGDWALSGTVTITWRFNSAGGYAAGNRIIKNGSWSNPADGFDMNFKIYVTENDTSVTMPSGYDQKAKVGYVYNDSSSNFDAFMQTDHLSRTLEF
ncbi:MAG: hypothetical protein HY434_01235, partial [Candidatus Liptonbacteria bacterium]|nr:hypothetical protein [Candidatus Liptonbacteria bacterium]